MTWKRLSPILMLLALAPLMAIPALADYLGPDRTVTTWVWKRLHCHYQAIYDPPGPGWYGCYLDLYEPPDATCPSTSSVVDYFNPKECNWPSDFCHDPGCSISLSSSIEGCSEGQTGCRATETTVTHPPATVSGSLTCAAPGNSGWCCGDGQLDLSGSEPLSGYTILALEGTRKGEVFACPGDSCSMPLLEGTNDFTFWALSSWGDSSLMGTASGKLDSAAPVITGEMTGVLGEAGWYVSQVTVAASASDAVSGVATFEMALDGGGWAAYAGPLTLSDGVHTIDLRAMDAAGNVSTQAQGVQIDTQPPALYLTADASFCPGCGEKLGITIDIQDQGSGVTAWTLSADGAAIKSGSGSSSETLAWNGSGLAAGGHTLLLQARDGASNASQTSQAVTLVAPTPAPASPPTSAPSHGGATETAPAATRTTVPTRTATGVAEAYPTTALALAPQPTRTPSTIVFGGPPAAPAGEAGAGSLSGSGSAPEPGAGGGSSNVLWGAGAAGLIAAATAIALEATRRRKEAEAREREEMERRNAQAEAREEAERQRMAALAAERQLQELAAQQEAEQLRQEELPARHDAEQTRAEALAAHHEAEPQHRSVLGAIVATVASLTAALESRRRAAEQRRLERNRDTPLHPAQQATAIPTDPGSVASASLSETPQPSPMPTPPPDTPPSPMSTPLPHTTPSPRPATRASVPSQVEGQSASQGVEPKMAYLAPPFWDANAYRNGVLQTQLAVGSPPYGPMSGNPNDPSVPANSGWVGLLANLVRLGHRILAPFANAKYLETMAPNVDLSVHYSTYADGAFRVTGAVISNNSDKMLIVGNVLVEGAGRRQVIYPFAESKIAGLIIIPPSVSPGETEFIAFDASDAEPIYGLDVNVQLYLKAGETAFFPNWQVPLP